MMIGRKECHCGDVSESSPPSESIPSDSSPSESSPSESSESLWSVEPIDCLVFPGLPTPRYLQVRDTSFTSGTCGGCDIINQQLPYVFHTTGRSRGTGITYCNYAQSQSYTARRPWSLFYDIFCNGQTFNRAWMDGSVTSWTSSSVFATDRWMRLSWTVNLKEGSSYNPSYHYKVVYERTWDLSVEDAPNPLACHDIEFKYYENWSLGVNVGGAAYCTHPPTVRVCPWNGVPV
jgi:hypothetical protein